MLSLMGVVIAANELGSELVLTGLGILGGVVGEALRRSLFGQPNPKSLKRVMGRRLQEAESQLEEKQKRIRELEKLLSDYKKRRGLTRRAVILAGSLRDTVEALQAKSNEAAVTAHKLVDCLGEPRTPVGASHESRSGNTSVASNDEGDDDSPLSD